MSDRSEKPHPHLDTVAQTVANDLKCKMDVALKQAMLGIAACAKSAGLPVSKKPTPDEIEQLLTEHGAKIEAEINKMQQKAKKAAAPTGRTRH